MPNYWNKAKVFFQQFQDGEFKNREVPLSVLAILANPTPEEIAEAKNLPYLQAVGILSYPASQCKFEIKYAVSLVGWVQTIRLVQEALQHRHEDIRICTYHL